MTSETLRSLASERGRGEARVLVTDLDTGEQHLIEGDSLDARSDLPLPDEVLAPIEEAIRFDRSEVVEHGGREYFVNVFNPPPRLIVVGAVHIAQPLATMADEAGFGVAVVDPREAFATEERFPGVEVVRAWPEEGLAALGIDHRTAVVTVTHDPKLDDPALRAALASPAFYVGALGSRRTHAKRVARLEEAGLTGDVIDRIHAPVGLSIGAKTPGEIAASVLAEVIRVMRVGDA